MWVVQHGTGFYSFGPDNEVAWGELEKATRFATLRDAEDTLKVCGFQDNEELFFPTLWFATERKSPLGKPPESVQLLLLKDWAEETLKACKGKVTFTDSAYEQNQGQIELLETLLEKFFPT
jgi:hypothetical protein